MYINKMAPFFSIGVTTNDRLEMLKETLDSILAQTFTDYEVVVSNDNPKRKISNQTMGIYDPRFKFANQTDNLGELSNMNYLLRESNGRYFTWIADDDLYHPEFLKSAHQTLLKYSFPKCVFTSFNVFKDEKPEFNNEAVEGADELFDGPDFLYRYSKGKAKTISVMGIFDRKTIQAMGGLEDISGDGKGMLCEYMLIVRAAMLDKIAYIREPLVLFRDHDGSWGKMSVDLDMYRRAVENLTCRSIEIFRNPQFRKHFYSYLYFIINFAILNVLGVMSKRRSFGDKSVRNVITYLIYARKYVDPLKRSGLYPAGIIVLIHAEIRIVLCLSARIIGKRFRALAQSIFTKEKKEQGSYGRA